MKTLKAVLIGFLHLVSMALFGASMSFFADGDNIRALVMVGWAIFLQMLVLGQKVNSADR